MIVNDRPPLDPSMSPRRDFKQLKSCDMVLAIMSAALEPTEIDPARTSKSASQSASRLQLPAETNISWMQFRLGLHRTIAPYLHGLGVLRSNQPSFPTKMLRDDTS